MKNARAKRAKLLFFIIKYANLLLELSNLGSKALALDSANWLGVLAMTTDDKEKVT